MMMAAGMLTATSCSDFDDYNKDPLDVSASANKTLWENISENENLSDFAAIIRKAGFDDELSQSHFYTVWAPLNGTFDAAYLLQEDSTELLRHFVDNHIANYNYTVSGPVDERIKVLNEKSYNFVGNGTYTFAGINVNQQNLPSLNGVIHTIDGFAHFYPNIYEYIFQANNADSLRNYFEHYQQVYLDEENSVIGPVVNGRQTYIDSVMVTTNSLYRQLNAEIANEDSSYTMMFPSNEAWKGAYDAIKPYFNYISNTVAQDVPHASSSSSYPTLTATVDAAYYTDSLVKRNIAKTLIFSNNIHYNQWVENGGVNTDTIRTTARVAISDPDEYLAQTKEKVQMSNGYARLVDSLAFHPWDTYAPELQSLNIGAVWSGSGSTVRVDNVDESKVTLENGATSLRYFWAQPTSNYAKPSVEVMLPNVLSTKYNIYCIVVPANVDKTDTITVVKPNQLDFSLSYCNANGKLAVQKLNQKVENDISKVDTVYVGQFSFPVCYYGLGSTYAPNIKITTDFGVFNKKMMDTYTRDIRIAGILLRPVEYDEYLGNKH